MGFPIADRAGIVDLNQWRQDHPGSAAAVELEPSALEAERRALAEERRRLEQDRAAFEEDLAVLEEQRHFLDRQREQLLQLASVIEEERRELDREQAAARAVQRIHVDAAFDDARRSVDEQRRRLQTEMARILESGARRG